MNTAHKNRMFFPEQVLSHDQKDHLNSQSNYREYVGSHKRSPSSDVQAVGHGCEGWVGRHDVVLVAEEQHGAGDEMQHK